jgi:hypothetical protein
LSVQCFSYCSAPLLHVRFNSIAYCSYGTVATIDQARQNKQWDLDTSRSIIRSYVPAGSALFLGMFARREENRSSVVRTNLVLPIQHGSGPARRQRHAGNKDSGTAIITFSRNICLPEAAPLRPSASRSRNILCGAVAGCVRDSARTERNQRQNQCRIAMHGTLLEYSTIGDASGCLGRHELGRKPTIPSIT